MFWLFRLFRRKKKISRTALLSNTGISNPLPDFNPQDLSMVSLSQWLTYHPLVLFLLGVNGSGKTSTIAKLIHILCTQHRIEKSKLAVIGTDTFRAAAMTQLQKRIQNLACDSHIPLDAKKPATALYQGLEKFGKTKDVILVDTSGRLHTHQNLMNELSALIQNGEKWIKAQSQTSCIKNVLICDGTHGNNLKAQIKAFSDHVTIDAIFFTKIDCVTEKGPLLATILGCQSPLLGLGIGERDSDMWHYATDFAKLIKS